MIIVGEQEVFDVPTIGVLTFIFLFIQIVFYLILARQLRPFVTLVSKAFGILGKKSGDVRANSAVRDDILGQVTDSPKFTALKMGAEMLGIDLEATFERHGPEKAIQGLLEIGAMFGITPEMLFSGALGTSPQGLLGAPGQGRQDNPYMRR